ncbi:N,N'-diacetylbacillosaminyl-diphospho-undecaprenol alpha-1,3-N-acetylgalactosaminyltransferase [BD1-7 clade bacterium]|uniref:N,N'-diacetylbacillosaminyl-diphospho-undecaprenol alpha-1,3-N-acetylgalactosaminyltransferase n=1 Tax=BD1-7 clade bacterium TaxID=2029982 RepID=A0A5S9QNG0_9GAMM|nr:N,N'-diacetylbacillosaminyl-diphospho-undecaprenol alpha-1,3-N-acetylgalactosaminyltransferase [BD1-7 clade bacterium]CAA0121456.1 N,N'-diacetylbacillosaminyl-diphospho-undecaprenol alpha-1,3-N-acetylgalactosaminyltransferase [BD1-7 clade bacterium]
MYVAVPICDEALGRELQSTGLQVVHIDLNPHSINPLAELHTAWQIWRIIFRLKPSILHLITLKPVIYGGVIARVKGLKTINSLAGLGRFAEPERKNYGCLAKCIRLWLKHFLSGTVVLENTWDMQNLQQLGVSANLQVIEGAGVDIDQYKSEQKSPDSIVKILFASRLIWKKGLGELVDACEAVNRDGARVELHVAGIRMVHDKDSIPRRQIERWQRQGDIIWHDNVSAMEDLISRCDLICLPTRYGEGIPRILIEAAACRRPIIAPDVAGCMDILKDGVNGFMYDRNSPLGLAQAMERAIDNKHRLGDLGESGREMVVEKFSDAVILEQWSQVYNANTQDADASALALKRKNHVGQAGD